MVEDGRAARFPFAPAAKSKAASPQALPTQRVKIGGLTYLREYKELKVQKDNSETLLLILRTTRGINCKGSTD